MDNVVFHKVLINPSWKEMVGIQRSHYYNKPLKISLVVFTTNKFNNLMNLSHTRSHNIMGYVVGNMKEANQLIDHLTTRFKGML